MDLQKVVSVQYAGKSVPPDTICVATLPDNNVQLALGRHPYFPHDIQMEENRARHLLAVLQEYFKEHPKPVPASQLSRAMRVRNDQVCKIDNICANMGNLGYSGVHNALDDIRAKLRTMFDPDKEI